MLANLPRPLTRPRFGAAVAIAALLAASLGACGKSADDAAAEVAAAAAAAEKSKEAPPEVPVTWPLTGLPGDVVERPALAVKVENAKAARPQSGLEQADVVWEEMVEGGESRFIAVFNSQTPDSVGPVRSVRPMDGPILGATGGLLACSGGQDRFLKQTKEAGLQVLTEDSGNAGFYRSSERSAPHNLYLKPAATWEQADDAHQGPPPGEFVFADSAGAASAARDGRPASTLAVTISAAAKPTWTWDESTKTYLRSERDVPSESAAGVRLAAHNVIALTVRIEMAGGTDAAGSPIPDTKIVGSGAGVVVSGGKALDVEWSKASERDPLVLRTPDGAEAKLAPGVTWIELVPSGEGTWVVS
ncbi:MAG: DUF3048 domain-containing protein [Bifidobacteriaceae bacterium]|jgi:hypothetical protein|nr:DUF3048 domain-containing protein [Bifidobacteriaceae bacterium]